MTAARFHPGLRKNAPSGAKTTDGLYIYGMAKAYTFVQALKAASEVANQGWLVTLGITPSYPETGYGYVEFPRNCAAGGVDALKVRRFHEKPELAKAKQDGIKHLIVFQHIPSRDIVENYVSEVHRVLRPGGVFVACTSARDDAPEILPPANATSFDAEEAPQESWTEENNVTASAP